MTPCEPLNNPPYGLLCISDVDVGKTQHLHTWVTVVMIATRQGGRWGVNTSVSVHWLYNCYSRKHNSKWRILQYIHKAVTPLWQLRPKCFIPNPPSLLWIHDLVQVQMAVDARPRSRSSDCKRILCSIVWALRDQNLKSDPASLFRLSGSLFEGNPSWFVVWFWCASSRDKNITQLSEEDFFKHLQALVKLLRPSYNALHNFDHWLVNLFIKFEEETTVTTRTDSTWPPIGLLLISTLFFARKFANPWKNSRIW